ncbi:MAG: hypothetical protein AAGI48_08800 [Verrucomicrobiota bacterium]
MASQNKLNSIFEDALRAEEATAETPSPAKVPAAAAVAEPEAATAVAEAPAQSESSNTNSEKVEQEHVSVDETDPEFAALLEEREGRIEKKGKRARWAVNLLFLGLFGGSATAFAVSPELRGKFEKLVVAVQESAADVKMMSKGTENYDEALEQVAVRGDQIDNATRMMGVDPTSVDPNDDPNMMAEMNQLAGEDVGLGSRLGKLETLGKVTGSLTGQKSKEEREAEASAAQ